MNQAALKYQFFMVLYGIEYHQIPTYIWQNVNNTIVNNTKSKDNISTSTRSTEVTNLCDSATQNCIRILDELTKAQPQYTQSVSNLQLDYVAAAKNTIQNIVSVQKMLASNVNFPIVTPQYTDEFVKRSNEITDNIVNALRINNQMTVNAINAAAENFRTFNRTIDSVTEFNTSAAKAWNSFVTTQQQQFLHQQ
jgi:hypothetical protein